MKIYLTKTQAGLVNVKEKQMLKMPYGKFKGQEIVNLPSSYLLWLAENIDEDTIEDMAICHTADEEWQFREKRGCHIE